MQQVVKPAGVQSNINVTPLVDVVLVLLIIFMIVAPQLQWGPAIVLPKTDEPPQRPDDGRQITVAMEHDGFFWVEGDRVSVEQFPEHIRAVAEARPDWHVVIKGDARLTFGQVERAMLEVEKAGFKDVGLIAEMRETGD